jgi:glycosyltransferase involved in cell wall biosynthesis
MFSCDYRPNNGGIATHVYELSKSLVKKGYRVSIITFKYDNITYEETDNIEVYRVIYPKMKIFIINYLIYIFHSLYLFYQLDKKNNFDIVHAHNVIPDGILLLFLHNKKKIITEHSSYFITSRNKFLNKLINKIIFSNVDHIITPSKELKKIITSLYKHLNVTYISNGVDSSFFVPTSCNYISKKFNILTTRRLVKKNGIEYLIKAIPIIIKKQKNVDLIIIGDGPEKNRYLELVNKYKINQHVHFMGFIENKELLPYYQKADIYILPSLLEATSISGLEAMSCGIPVIGSNIGGIPHIIEDGKTGILVPPKDSKSLANNILYLLNNSYLRKKMGFYARKKVLKEHTWEFVAKQVIDIYGI